MEKLEPILFDQKSMEFLHWFSRYGGPETSRVSEKIRIVDLRGQGAGRGVVAIQDLEEGEELFAVPRTLVLDVQNSDLVAKVRNREALPDTNAWLPLIVTIIYEYLRGQNSPWAPYFAILPNQFNTLMFWSDAELAELQGSEVVSKIGKKQAEETWNVSIIPYMLRNTDLFPMQGTEDRKTQKFIELAHWAGSLIMAYAFDIDKDESSDSDDDDDAGSEEDILVEDSDSDGEEILLKGMVPFADLLNADADRNNARLYQTSTHLRMLTTRLVSAGSELYNDYGPLPSSDLLRMYGYLTPNYALYDVVELSQILIRATAAKSDPVWKKASDENMAKLEELGLMEEGYAIQRPGENMTLRKCVPGELHMFLRALCCGLGNEQQNENDDPHASLSTGSSSKEAITVAEAALLSAACTKRLSDYATTLEEDVQLSVTLESSSPRLVDALTVRKGEKEILHSIIRLCQNHIEAQNSKIAGASAKRKLGEEGRATEREKKARREKRGRGRS